MINIILDDNSNFVLQEPTTIYNIIQLSNPMLIDKVCCALVDDKVQDLRFIIKHDCKLSIVTFDNDAGKRAFWHTASHVMAQAVKKLFPNAKLAIGPAARSGFYYDFEFENEFSDNNLSAIETEMGNIVNSQLDIERFSLSREDALNFMRDEPYKIELINRLSSDAEISFYRQGDFTDLCAGPHLMNTKYVKAFKLISVAGAYWHGDENNKMLTRIYGVAFPSKEELDKYLNYLEEAKKRDHRKIGNELELFTLLEEAPGMPFFLPNGQIIKNNLIDYWRKIHNEANYKEISTPIILNQELWKRSGHWDHYRDNMYFTLIDDKEFAIKPMNCPGSILVYKSKTHSYRDLPLRLAELGIVHRHEKSGVLHGLMRVRCFTQDDAHIFITQDQIKSEVVNIISLIDKVYYLFGFKYKLELSTRPKDSMGSDEQWEKATEALHTALLENNLNFKINEGDGAFYGPKIDFHLEDSIGRTWQCGTIQLDFQMPEKFNLEYAAKDGKMHTPIMIHRVVFGSVERFIGILIEHYAGHFPIWLAPVQVRVLPISDKFIDYSTKIFRELQSNGIRVELDNKADKIGYKIRDGKLKRVPYLIIVGEKEETNQTISLRTKDDKSTVCCLSDFILEIKNKILQHI